MSTSQPIKERPILYSAPMVRARHSGAKRKTRRIVKPQPALSYFVRLPDGTFGDEEGETTPIVCPFGKVGDRLWGRETYALLTDPGALTTWDLQIPDSLPSLENTQLGHVPTPIYRADGERPDVSAGNQRGPMRWRPGIHMPRWASRMLDEITEVSSERLQDITDEDALAEGVKTWAESDVGMALLRGLGFAVPDRPRFLFQMLWSQINGTASWDANPWVWVISFRPVQL